MKTTKIVHYLAKGLLSALLILSASMYLFKNADISIVFESLGYPAYIVYPLAFAKISAVIVLWLPKIPTLKEWAYSALFFEFTLAVFAHIMVGDGEQMGAILAIVLLITTYLTCKKLNTVN